MRRTGASFVHTALRVVPAILSLLFCLLAVPLQMIIPSLPGMAAKPDLPAMLVAYAAFRLPLIPSFGLAAVAGFWRDLLVAGHIGPGVLACTLAAILIFVLRQALSARSIYFFPPLAGLGTFLVLGISYGVRLLEFREWSWPAAAWGEFAIASVLTAAISFPAGWFFDWSVGLLLAGTPAENEDDLVEIEPL